MTNFKEVDKKGESKEAPWDACRRDRTAASGHCLASGSNCTGGVGQQSPLSGSEMTGTSCVGTLAWEGPTCSRSSPDRAQ